MAIRKSELYPSFWSNYNGFRGSIDAGPYKDCILVFMFVKSISDKYGGIPEPTGLQEMVAIKDKTKIDDKISRKIMRLYSAANLLTASHGLLFIEIALFCRFEGCIDRHHGTYR